MKRFIPIALLWLIVTGQAVGHPGSGPGLEYLLIIPVGCTMLIAKKIEEAMEDEKTAEKTPEQERSAREAEIAEAKRVAVLHQQHLGEANCAIAGSKDNGARQFRVGWDFEWGKGVDQNFRSALLWYSLAKKNGSIPGRYGVERLSGQVKPEELVEIRRKVADWKPDLALCEQPAESTKQMTDSAKPASDDDPAIPAATINP